MIIKLVLKGRCHSMRIVTIKNSRVIVRRFLFLSKDFLLGTLTRDNSNARMEALAFKKELEMYDMLDKSPLLLGDGVHFLKSIASSVLCQGSDSLIVVVSMSIPFGDSTGI